VADDLRGAASEPRSTVGAGLPLPPVELADRAGTPSGADESLEPFLSVGLYMRGEIERLLPDGWSWTGKRVLDFGCGAGRVLRHFLPQAGNARFVGCDIDAPSIAWIEEHLSPPFEAFVNSEAPPLAQQPDSSFDLVYATSVFTHITDEWSGWLLDLHRVLREDGLLIVTVLGRGASDQIAGEQWDADRIGMNVLQQWSIGGPKVLISEWWLRAHWGRLFTVMRYEPASAPGLHDLVLLRSRLVNATREELERPEPGEARELDAVRHNVRQMHREARLLREAEQWARSTLDYERAAHGEARRDPAPSRSEAFEQLERTLEELRRSRVCLASIARSKSWRVTAPLRAAKRRWRATNQRGRSTETRRR